MKGWLLEKELMVKICHVQEAFKGHLSHETGFERKDLSISKHSVNLVLAVQKTSTA